ncbi:MAG: sulfatase-like hydrolase/transferase [Kiritimatiellae bacterium]|nr:sulfatase-like hydrolase/transferase [Kiritimatiellia bacterium]
MRRPNIVFILIDDLGCRDLGCYGTSFHEAPCLDRLAEEGIRFTHAYAATLACSPTRASILTGEYPARIDTTDWIDWLGKIHPARGRLVDAPYVRALTATEYSLSHALRDAGYATWHVGKWHLGGKGTLPEDHGLEVNIGGSHTGSPGRRGYFSPRVAVWKTMANESCCWSTGSGQTNAGYTGYLVSPARGQIPWPKDELILITNGVGREARQKRREVKHEAESQACP